MKPLKIMVLKAFIKAVKEAGGPADGDNSNHVVTPTNLYDRSDASRYATLFSSDSAVIVTYVQSKTKGVLDPIFCGPIPFKIGIERGNALVELLAGGIHFRDIRPVVKEGRDY